MDKNVIILLLIERLKILTDEVEYQIKDNFPTPDRLQEEVNKSRKLLSQFPG